MFLLGRRGDRPVRLRAPSAAVARTVSSLHPGSVVYDADVYCTWDVAPFVAADLGVGMPPAPTPEPCYSDLHPLGDLGSRLRPYQKAAVLFMAIRSGCINADDMRLGKTIEAMAAARAIGARHVLVLGPAIAKRNWARQTAKHLGERMLLLYGRGANVGRIACDCLFDKACDRCKGKGLIKVKGAELERWIHDAYMTFANYDITQGQFLKNERGRLIARPDLPGWTPVLSGAGHDLVIGDEAHRVRGFSTATKMKGHTRREMVQRITDPVSVVWLLTGTPIASFVRDLWALLDLATKGAASSGYRRTPFQFHDIFCGGHHGTYGWVSNGITSRAALELGPRLKCYMIRRTRKEVAHEMPDLEVEVIRLSPDEESRRAGLRAIQGRGTEMNRLQRALLTTTKLKINHVAPTVADARTVKHVVFVYRKQSVELFSAKLRAELAGSTRKRGKKQKVTTTDVEGVRIFMCDGDVPVERRDEMSVDFVEHVGGAVFIATIDSIPESISLVGAEILHFVDLHAEAFKLSQAMARAAEPGVSSISVLFYTVEGSIDDHRIDLLLPKIDAQQRVVGDDSLAEFADRAQRQPDFAAINHAIMESISREQSRDLDAEFVELGID